MSHLTRISSAATIASTASPDSVFSHDGRDDLDELDSIASSPPFGQGHHDNPYATLNNTVDILVDLHNVDVQPRDVSHMLTSIARIVKQMHNKLNRLMHVLVRLDESRHELLDHVIRNNAAEPYYGSEEGAIASLIKLGGKKKAVMSMECDIAIGLTKQDWNVVWFNISSTNLSHYHNSEVFTIVNFHFLPGNGWDRGRGALNNHETPTEAMIYMDWENINVEYDMLNRFIESIKAEVRKTYPGVIKPAFAMYMGSSITPDNRARLRRHLPRYITLNIIGDPKHNAVDDAIKDSMDLEFPATSVMQQSWSKALVMVSGDRDFQSKLVRLSRYGVCTMLVCNHVTNEAYRSNAHFTKSVLYDELEGLEMVRYRRDHRELKSGKDQRICSFYNSRTKCKFGAACTYDHRCYCGSKDHDLSYHWIRNKIGMKLPCKEWNMNRCTVADAPCPHGKLHVCFTCLSPDHIDHEPHPCKQRYKCLASTCVGRVFETRVEFEDHLANYRHGAVPPKK